MVIVIFIQERDKVWFVLFWRVLPIEFEFFNHGHWLCSYFLVRHCKFGNNDLNIDLPKLILIITRHGFLNPMTLLIGIWMTNIISVVVVHWQGLQTRKLIF
jgi:hypothetical protein